jgi:hypothetical protein
MVGKDGVLRTGRQQISEPGEEQILLSLDFIGP